MKPIDVIALSDLSPAYLSDLGLVPAVSRTFGVNCRIRPESVDALFARDGRREQYYSTAILQALQPIAPECRLLAVTSCDLFVPILTFVFGEAQLDGNCAVVSLHRLREEVYGMPPNPALLKERLIKEAVHELGHTFGLRHCEDWRCAMSSSHSVEWLDVKSADFCNECQKVVTGRPGGSAG